MTETSEDSEASSNLEWACRRVSTLFRGLRIRDNVVNGWPRGIHSLSLGSLLDAVILRVVAMGACSREDREPRILFEQRGENSEGQVSLP